MTDAIHIDSAYGDDDRRTALYNGQFFVYSQRQAILRLVEFARGLIDEAFAPLDPQTAQHELPVERFAEILGQLKPKFIHHPESKMHLRSILSDLGCDPTQTYFDVPRLRSSTSEQYLTSGIAYAWHPHRDTWYSAPLCQLNWWLPVYEIRANNCMAFHPNYWNRAVRNDSAGYNYYVWNQVHRGPEVARMVKQDPRPLPHATEPMELEPQLRLLCPVGGMIVFSGAQMHSSVPNTSSRTRYSIDFRTVHLGDARSLVGAPQSDEACTGTTMRDYMRCSDLQRLTDDVISLYDDGTSHKGAELYVHQVSHG